MARPLRIDFDGAWHHVMNRGAAKRPIFHSKVQRTMFLCLLGEMSTVNGIEVHAYCLMDNHYHLLLHTPSAGLSRAMRHLNGVYTQRFNRVMSSDGPLFRGRYNSVLIESDVHLCRVSRYIHLNPVDAGLVARPELFGASSYRAYVGSETVPSWLHTEETLARFDSKDPCGAYREFVEAGVDTETESFYSRRRLAPVLGGETFRQRALDLVRASPVANDPEVPARTRVVKRPPFDLIAAAVIDVFGVRPEQLRPWTSRLRNSVLARGAVVYLAREVGGRTLRGISSWMGYGSYAAASKAMLRLRAEMERDPVVRQRVALARDRLVARVDGPKCPAKT